MTPLERQALRDAALRSPLGTWKLQTSNSFRRIGVLGDGDVLCGIVQRYDGQPDLLAGAGVLDYIVAAQPWVVLELLGALDEAQAALYQALSLVPGDVVTRDLLAVLDKLRGISEDGCA